jgi:hypothetical protein
MYNFDVSRVLHESRLKELEPKIKQYMTELAQAQ